MLGKLLKKKALNIIGLMSGTSADGLDIAYCRISGSRQKISLRLRAVQTYKYGKKAHALIKSLALAEKIAKEDCTRAENDLSDFYVKKIRQFMRSSGLPEPDLIGSHGQTIYHADPRLNRCGGSWQIVDGSRLSCALKIPVVFDFRADDTALGGSGAPLMPICHHYMFAQNGRNTAVMNIGGISNLTYLPAKSGIDSIDASDCGPGNMIIDEIMCRLFKRNYDRNGSVACKGAVSNRLLKFCLNRAWYRKSFPKSLGREQFGEDFIDGLLKKAKQLKLSKNDIMATCSEITISSVLEYLDRFKAPDDLILCGGGAKNRYFINRFTEEIPNCKVQSSDTYGFDADYVEAAGFALLAYLNIRNMPANLPRITGAERKTVLGKIALP